MRRTLYPGRAGFPHRRIHDMMEEAAVDFVLTEQPFIDKLGGFPIRYTDCEICGVETLPGDGTQSPIRNALLMCFIHPVLPDVPRVSA